jgi:hypothetical protein
VVYFGGFFAKLGHFAGFSVHIIDIAGYTPHCDFCGFFLFIVRRKDQRSCDVRGGITRVYAHRRNWFPPPPHPDVSVSTPWDPKGGGEPHSLAVECVGDPIRTTG